VSNGYVMGTMVMELMQADLMRLFVVLYERCMTPTGAPHGEDPSSFDYVARQYKR
jgi:hypothetical protein